MPIIEEIWVLKVGDLVAIRLREPIDPLEKLRILADMPQNSLLNCVEAMRGQLLPQVHMLRWAVDVEADREVGFLIAAAAFLRHVLPGRVDHEDVAVTAGLQDATLQLQGRHEGIDAARAVYELSIRREEHDREAVWLVPIRVTLLLIGGQSVALLVHRDS